MTDHALAPSRSGDWRYWFGEHRGTLLALAVFVVMFVIYTSNHQAGFSADVVTTAANPAAPVLMKSLRVVFIDRSF